MIFTPSVLEFPTDGLHICIPIFKKILQIDSKLWTTANVVPIGITSDMQPLSPFLNSSAAPASHHILEAQPVETLELGRERT